MPKQVLSKRFAIAGIAISAAISGCSSSPKSPTYDTENTVTKEERMPEYRAEVIRAMKAYQEDQRKKYQSETPNIVVPTRNKSRVFVEKDTEMPDRDSYIEVGLPDVE